MPQEIALDNVAIHARFNQISASRSYVRDTSRHVDAKTSSQSDKTVAKLLLGLGACVLVSISVGIVLLMLNLKG